MAQRRWMIATGALAITGMLLAGCTSGGGGSPEPTDHLDTSLLTPEGKLTEPADVTINVASRAVLDFSAPLLAEELGVFDDYGINLTIESVPTNEAVPLLATGKVDAVIGGLNAGVFNAIGAGSDLRVVAPANYQSPESKIGTWASAEWLAGRDFEPSMLKVSKHASSQGYQGITMVNYVRLLKEGGLTVDDVDIVTMPQTDQVVALETGAISTGTPSPAGADALERSGKATYIAQQIPTGWPVTVFTFGPSLLEDRPEVGMAFVAALRALYTDYLQGDYIENPEVFDALVKVSEQTPEAVRSAVPFIYGPEMSIPDDYISAMDETWRLFPDVLQSEKPFTFDDVIDTRFMDYANGL